ncbi:MAG: hypothetical protein JWP07_1169, partial [Pseudonocardiales bacterium]|nr:hypothetical protein [Pseudonocardiales bacterium]
LAGVTSTIAPSPLGVIAASAQLRYLPAGIRATDRSGDRNRDRGVYGVDAAAKSAWIAA